jgi:hypothetical protein
LCFEKKIYKTTKADIFVKNSYGDEKWKISLKVKIENFLKGPFLGVFCVPLF